MKFPQYEMLEEWAKRHNMAFKVDISVSRECYELYMCDAIDGYMRSECVRISFDPSEEPFWYRQRYVLKKNEEFLELFLRHGRPIQPTDWIGAVEAL